MKDKIFNTTKEEIGESYVPIMAKGGEVEVSGKTKILEGMYYPTSFKTNKTIHHEDKAISKGVWVFMEQLTPSGKGLYKNIENNQTYGLDEYDFNKIKKDIGVKFDEGGVSGEFRTMEVPQTEKFYDNDDYYVDNQEKYEAQCRRCGKGIKNLKYAFHEVEGGGYALHKDDYDIWLADEEAQRGDLGAQYLGTECKKYLDKDYYYDETSLAKGGTIRKSPPSGTAKNSAEGALRVGGNGKWWRVAVSKSDVHSWKELPIEQQLATNRIYTIQTEEEPQIDSTFDSLYYPNVIAERHNVPFILNPLLRGELDETNTWDWEILDATGKWRSWVPPSTKPKKAKAKASPKPKKDIELTKKQFDSITGDKISFADIQKNYDIWCGEADSNGDWQTAQRYVIEEIKQSGKLRQFVSRTPNPFVNATFTNNSINEMLQGNRMIPLADSDFTFTLLPKMHLLYEAWEKIDETTHEELGIVSEVLYDEYSFQIHLTTFVNGKFKDIDANLNLSYISLIALLRGSTVLIEQWVKSKWVKKIVELRKTGKFIGKMKPSSLLFKLKPVDRKLETRPILIRNIQVRRVDGEYVKIQHKLSKTLVSQVEGAKQEDSFSGEGIGFDNFKALQDFITLLIDDNLWGTDDNHAERIIFDMIIFWKHDDETKPIYAADFTSLAITSAGQNYVFHITHERARTDFLYNMFFYWYNQFISILEESLDYLFALPTINNNTPAKTVHKFITDIESIVQLTDLDTGKTLTPTKPSATTTKPSPPSKPTTVVKGLSEAKKKVQEYDETKFFFATPPYTQEELNQLLKLLPHFQGAVHSLQRAEILKEISRIHKEINELDLTENSKLAAGVPELSTSIISPTKLLEYYFTQTTQQPTAQLDKPCGLPTPNGKKSKLPLATYLAVREAYFKKYFGDWENAYETKDYSNCSKIIDEETKEPRIMYHAVRKFVPNFGHYANMGQGVKRPYGEFDPPTFPASYFSGNKAYVEFYGGTAPNQKKPKPDYQPFIYSVFLNMRNIIHLDELGFKASYKNILDFLYVKYGVVAKPSHDLLKKITSMDKEMKVWNIVRHDISLIETLKLYGYDGLIQIGDVPTFNKQGEPQNTENTILKEKEYLTFYPNQVKSATVKRSFYLDYFNDIRFKKGGNVCI